MATEPTARIIGYVSMGKTDDNSLNQIPIEFRQYLGIMGKEAADNLLEHRSYNRKIDLREGSTAPWGPI